ncbi:MAG: hypothetical protein OHK0052_07010 [Anaerolineales bacterium]
MPLTPRKPLHTRLILLLTLLLAVPAALFLAQPVRAFETDPDGYIEANQTIEDDIQIAAHTIIIDGTINGNAILSAGTVEINGSINGNLIINAGVININGPVSGTVLIAGQHATLAAPVQGSFYFAGISLQIAPTGSINRNLTAFGYNINLQNGATIARDANINAYQLLLDGEINRNLYADLGAFQHNGRVGGDVTLKISPPGETKDFSWLSAFDQTGSAPAIPASLTTGLRIAPEAQIGGSLTYSSAADQTETIRSAPANGITFNKVEPKPQVEVQFNPFVWLLSKIDLLATLLVIAALLQWQKPTLLPQFSQTLRRAPLPAFGWGLLAFIGGYVLTGFLGIVLLISSILFAVITFGNLAGLIFGFGFSTLSMAFAFFLLLVSHVSKLVIAFWIGETLAQRLNISWLQHPKAQGTLGIFIYVAIRAIPIFGLLLGILATLMGLGSLWLTARGLRGSASTPMVVPAPEV